MSSYPLVKGNREMVEETRVLLVDDEVNHCKTLAFILSRKGYAHYAGVQRAGSHQKYG